MSTLHAIALGFTLGVLFCVVLAATGIVSGVE